MNAGKSAALLLVAHNYEEKNNRRNFNDCAFHLSSFFHKQILRGTFFCKLRLNDFNLRNNLLFNFCLLQYGLFRKKTECKTCKKRLRF